MKRANKGKVWQTTGMALHEAHSKVKRMEGTELMSIRELKKFRLSIAKNIAEGFCKNIQNGRMFEAFLNAGARFKKGKTVTDDLMQLYHEYCEDPNGEKGGEALRELEEKEEDLWEGMAYECM